MRTSQLESARRYHRELEELFSKSTSSFSLYHGQLECRRLCSAAWLAVEDNFCREQLDLIELYAEELFAEAARLKGRGGAAAGKLDLLGAAIAKCLDAFESRLASLEAMA